MRYFPLASDRFEHQFGVRALSADDSLIEATEAYEDEVKLRRELLSQSDGYYYRAIENSVTAQREACDLVIDSASFLRPGHNVRTGELIDLKSDQPLLEIARHVQEDLTVLRGDPDAGFPLIAGAIAFPSGWCVGDKIGQNVLAVHRSVPEFADRLNSATQQLLTRLKLGRPVWRMNWGVRPSGRLDQSPIQQDYLDECRNNLLRETIGRECYFRVERQTLSRLPGGDILFTIHTHQSPLEDLDADERHKLRGTIAGCPEATLRYKGILPFRSLLLDYLV